MSNGGSSRIKHIALLAAAASLIAAISVRGWEHTLTALPHVSTACPKGVRSILVIGQSHASNTGPKRHVAWTDSYSFHAGKCFYLRDPMPGTAGRGGSIWPKFAEALGKPAVIANIAISGSAIDKWTTDRQLALVREKLAAMKKAGYPDPLVIWMQGETDAGKQTDAATYLAELRKLHAVAPGSRWLIVRESICYGRQRKYRPLDDARDRLAREHANVTVGPDLDKFPLSFRGDDKCHLTAEGQDILARTIADAARPLLR